MKINKTWLLIILLLISLGVRLPGLFSRAIWYDEAITLLETAGNAKPAWPKDPCRSDIAKKNFIGTPSLSEIATGLYETDIHPPIYFWILSIWRQWFGFSLEMARIFSLICSIGSVCVLYLLLKIGKIEHPIIPCLVFSISSATVFAGQDARSYALTSLLIMMSALFAYLAIEEKGSRSRLVIYSIAMVLSCGIAFQTNYLALFPVLAILLWFLINIWSTSKWIATYSILGSFSIFLGNLFPFLRQLISRPHESKGFQGIIQETSLIIKNNTSIFWRGGLISHKIVFIIILYLMLYISIVYIVTNWTKLNKKLILLFIQLAIAPSIGVFLLDLFFNKHISSTYRYFLFAAPAISVILTCGITRHRLTKFLLTVLIGLELAVINYGKEITPGFPGSNLRSLAHNIKNDSLTTYIVIIGAGFGRGHVGSVIYELDAKSILFVLDNDSDLGSLTSRLKKYNDLWIVPSIDYQTFDVESRILKIIHGSRLYSNVSRKKSFIHFWN